VRLAAILSAVLLACAAYEAAIALKWISIGNEPGEGATGSGWVLGVALLAMLVGIVACAAAVRARRAKYALVAPAAAAFVVARFYTFDPYYAPGLRRASDGGIFPAWWVYGVAAACVAAAALARTGFRAASLLSAAALLVTAITSWAMYAGH